VQVVVATHSLCWRVQLQAHLVVLLGTEYYDGKEHRYVDYPVTDVLRMIGLASRPREAASGVCAIYCHQPRKQFYLKFLNEPLPVESHFDHFLANHLNTEVVTHTVENKQDAIDYLTWTFYYHRLRHNANYYGVAGTTHQHVSDALSELVENCIADLEQSQCLAVEDEIELSPLNLGMVASYYYCSYLTIELAAASLTARTKMKGLIEILSAASEFERLPVRHREPKLLARLAAHLPVQLDKADFAAVHTKANVLLQAHFSRRQLTAELAADQALVVERAALLLRAFVDVIASNAWLQPALAAMELAQMTVQALWDSDSELKQLPHLTPEVLARAKAADVQGVFDVLELEDQERASLFAGLSARQMGEVARVCNRYPSVELEHRVLQPSEVQSGGACTVGVRLQRDLDEGEALGPVPAPYFPAPKAEGWWLVVGDAARNKLYAIKRVNLARTADVKLMFEAPEPGTHQLTLFFMSDSWLGADQEFEFELQVAESEDSSSSDEDEDEDKDSDGDEGAGDGESVQPMEE
jgi:pre-mRNA-splicing helicase BRR2